MRHVNRLAGKKTSSCSIFHAIPLSNASEDSFLHSSGVNARRALLFYQLFSDESLLQLLLGALMIRFLHCVLLTMVEKVSYTSSFIRTFRWCWCGCWSWRFNGGNLLFNETMENHLIAGKIAKADDSDDDEDLRQKTEYSYCSPLLNKAWTLFTGSAYFASYFYHNQTSTRKTEEKNR